MRLLDLFCCQGGASAGYIAAGFEVVGVDMSPQPRYPFEFVQANALEILGDGGFMRGFDAVHASPPCQRYTRARSLRKNDHPDLVGPARAALDRTGLPYVIENVEGAPLRSDLLLCGTMFGIRTYRHRVFEFGAWQIKKTPFHPTHTHRSAQMGRPVKDGEFMTVVGNFSGADLAREIMGMPWASQNGLREAIPPVYTEFIGRQMMESSS